MTLRELRERKAYTITEVAAACDVTAAAVYSWEKGNMPSFPKLRKLAAFLGVTVDDIRTALQESAKQAS